MEEEKVSQAKFLELLAERNDLMNQLMNAKAENILDKVPDQYKQWTLATIAELIDQAEKEPQLDNGHEGFAKMYAKLDAVWDEVKRHHGELEKTRVTVDLIELAALAIRFMSEVKH